MEYAVSINPRGTYLHVQVRGDNDADTIHRYFDEVLAACAAQDIRHVLVEEFLEGPALSVTDVFQIVSSMAEEIRSVLRLIAFVDGRPGRSPLNVRFGETVAVNRGLAVRTFELVTEAEAWLAGEIVRREAGRRASAAAPGSTGRRGSGTAPASVPARA